MFKPVTLPCGHSCCKKCLENLVVATLSTNPPHCPVCRQEMPANLNINVCLHQLTNNLAVGCSNAGCSWKGSYAEAESHESECPKWVVECVNEGCGHSATREEIREHGGTCKKAQVRCAKCRKRVAREDLQLHLEKSCWFSMMDCPLGCGATLPRYVKMYSDTKVKIISPTEGKIGISIFWCLYCSRLSSCRCHVHVHMHECSQKALSCDVPGCRNITRRISMREHYINAAESDQQLAVWWSSATKASNIWKGRFGRCIFTFINLKQNAFFWHCFFAFYDIFREQEVVYYFHNRSGKPFYFNLIVSHLIQSIHRRPHFNLFGVKTTYFKPILSCLPCNLSIMLFNLSISASGYKRSTLSGRSLLSLWNFTRALSELLNLQAGLPVSQWWRLLQHKLKLKTTLSNTNSSLWPTV